MTSNGMMQTMTAFNSVVAILAALAFIVGWLPAAEAAVYMLLVLSGTVAMMASEVL